MYQKVEAIINVAELRSKEPIISHTVEVENIGGWVAQLSTQSAKVLEGELKNFCEENSLDISFVKIRTD